MRTETQTGAQITQEDEVVFVWAIVKKEDYPRVKLPEGSVAKALEIGPAGELCSMENCKGWGGLAGIALARFAKKAFPQAFAIMNPGAAAASMGLVSSHGERIGE